MADISLAYLGKHEPLTGDAQERFHEVVYRLDGWLSEDQAHASANCPVCGCTRALSITYDHRGVAIRCNARPEDSDYLDSCDPMEILLAIGVWLSDLKVIPPCPSRPLQAARQLDPLAP